jgi:hypothetical protein
MHGVADALGFDAHAPVKESRPTAAFPHGEVFICFRTGPVPNCGLLSDLALGNSE